MTRALCLLALLLARLSPAVAQEAVAAPQSGGVQQTAEGVSLDFQNADIRVVVSALADVARLNVVFSNLPQRPVTLRTSGPVSPEEVKGYLESLAAANGLEMTEEGGLIRISGGEQSGGAPAAPQYGRPQAQSQARLYVYPLLHARADALARTVGALFGIGGGGGGEPWSPGQSLSQQLRDQRAMPILAPPAAPAPAPAASPATDETRSAGLAAGLQSAAQIVPDDRTNSLLIRASPADYETIRTAIQALDVRPMQVLIEVLIAEVRRDRQSALGITVQSEGTARTGPEIHLGSSTSLVGKSGESLGSMLLRLTDLGPDVDAELILQALASSGEVTILSRPVVLAQNNQEARILVGSERPFIQLFRSLPTDAAIRDQVVQYRDVGTQLTIRPTINQDGYVSLSVLQEISTAASETQFGPVISTREAQTELLVKDRHTAVIGGLVDNQREFTNSGIPLLKDLPLIGHLFRSTTRRRTSTELFLFLTPRVIRTDEEMEAVTEEVRESTEVLKRRLEQGLPVFEAGDTIPPADVPAAPAPAPGGAPGGEG